MKKTLLLLFFIGLSISSCETSNTNEEIGLEILDPYSTGQGEVGDPSDDDDEEGGA
ncbi:hypothetical protein [Aquimarina spongiae]|uniref:Skin active peptide family signal and propeptide n=1 Tax=Aquimarina spongiae TaxID=570521 RepID=A0A1M6JDL9_9FLAO|nr:hypothetical protein [Aquimarina spongiae]SHJ44773.1 Frog skin active peptide family signal and propeptide [Aquimarina spongiae]